MMFPHHAAAESDLYRDYAGQEDSRDRWDEKSSVLRRSQRDGHGAEYPALSAPEEGTGQDLFIRRTDNPGSFLCGQDLCDAGLRSGRKKFLKV